MQPICRRWRWWVLAGMLLVPPQALVTGCMGMLRPELAGWWEVEFASDEWEATPASSQLVSLLNIGGCYSTPDVFSTELSFPLINSRIRLDAALTVQEFIRCDSNESEAAQCESVDLSQYGETGNALASEVGVLSPGRYLGYIDPIVVTDSGETEIELHSRRATYSPLEDSPSFPADDALTQVRVRWERTVTWLPPAWGPLEGEIIRESTVAYTLLDDIPADMYAYPGGLNPPGPEVTTQALEAGATLELRRRLTLIFTRLDG